MIVIIAGGRNFVGTPEDAAWLDALHFRMRISGVVHGGAPGADRFGATWAAQRGIPIKEFLADWDQHGRAAGPIRNQQMCDFICRYPQRAVILFPGGRGTASMRDIAMKAGVEVYDRS